jgi:TRAP transporter 4TM/12TM fusion protein
MAAEAAGQECSRKNFLKIITGILCVAGSLFYLYTGFFGQFSPVLQMTPLLVIALVLGFLNYPLKKSRSWLSLTDYALAFFSVGVGIYMVATEKESTMALAPPTGLKLIAAWALIFLVLEATRRVMGWSLVIITIGFLIYPRYGNYIPGIFHHWGFDWSRIADYTSLSSEGIFGLPVYVCATIIIFFLIFAALLRLGGGGEFFINISQALVGRFRGGSAKMAVVASYFFGMMSGSAVANVATVGTITIPLMTKAGYPPLKAASVEALASTGGQFTPPVMGAAAFLMAEITGRPYWEVCVAAFFPAFLYFISLFFIVDFEAAKIGLKGQPREMIPSWKTEFRRGWFLLLPLGILLYFLGVVRISPMRACLYAIIALMIVSAFGERTRIGARKLYEALESGMRGMAEVTLACACGGIMIASMYLTNFGVGLSTALVAVSGGNMLILLILTAITSLILGLGLTTSACYLLLAIMVGPTLVKMGMPLMGAHLFILYFGCLSTITPPVATASYGAAAIAGTDPMRTGWIATFWATIAYIMPFFYVYQPALLLQGKIMEMVSSMAFSTLGVIAFAAMIQGYLLREAKMAQRLLLGLGGLLMVYPGWMTTLPGIVMVAAVVLWQYQSLRKPKVSLVVP